MTTTTYSEAPYRIQQLINACPADGEYHQVDGYDVCIEPRDGDITAAIYEPGGTTEGECDWYVDLTEVPEVAN